MATVSESVCCYVCGGRQLRTTFHYDAPPSGETRFSFSVPDLYQRDVVQCVDCRHFMSSHQMDVSEMYTNEYVDSTYGASGIRKTFDKIVGLDPSRSDNVGRCNRVDEFARCHFAEAGCETEQPSVIDIGSGLCVFLHRMKSLGWRGTALDPDPRAIEHAKSHVGVDAICGDFFQVEIEKQFDLVAFNKVLEHVADPVEMLARSRNLIHADGLVYLEVPDGEFAATDGQGREEFFVEHLHVFSLLSTVKVCQRAGFDVKSIERLREPSTKYTIRAFLSAGSTCG